MNTFPVIHTCAGLSELIQEVGFLPLLESCVAGFSAMEIVDEECRYIPNPEGGFDWPLWDWKGPIILEGNCAYGKFFANKAGFVSLEWWNDFCNYRRSIHPAPQEGSIEEAIVDILEMNGSMTTRDLRRACEFTGKGMRSRFDSYITRLQMECRIVTEDFVYPHDSHDKPYGWGWSLLTTPERRYGHQACTSDHTPEESWQRLKAHFHSLLPKASESQIKKLIG